MSIIIWDQLTHEKESENVLNMWRYEKNNYKTTDPRITVFALAIYLKLTDMQGYYII